MSKSLLAVVLAVAMTATASAQMSAQPDTSTKGYVHVAEASTEALTGAAQRKAWFESSVGHILGGTDSGGSN